MARGREAGTPEDRSRRIASSGARETTRRLQEPAPRPTGLLRRHHQAQPESARALGQGPGDALEHDAGARWEVSRREAISPGSAIPTMPERRPRSLTVALRDTSRRASSPKSDLGPRPITSRIGLLILPPRRDQGSLSLLSDQLFPLEAFREEPAEPPVRPGRGPPKRAVAREEGGHQDVDDHLVQGRRLDLEGQDGAQPESSPLSRATESRMPFTKPGERSPPKRRASSTASSMAISAGVSVWRIS